MTDVRPKAYGCYIGQWITNAPQAFCHPVLFRDSGDASPLASPPVLMLVICPLVACLVKIAIYGWVEGGPVQTWGGGTSFRGPTCTVRI